MECIVGRTVPYRPQWDNTIDPGGTCNVTSMVHALEICGIMYSHPDGMQPEDYLAKLLESPESYSRMARLYRWAVGTYRPRHIHAMLSWAVNEKLVGREVTFFTERASMQEIIYHIWASRTPIVTGGRFTPYGHIVTVVGFETAQEDFSYVSSPDSIELAAVRTIIINDSWGNYLTGYRDRNGYNVRLPYHTFVKLVKTEGSEKRKFAHFFYPDGTVPAYLEHLR